METIYLVIEYDRYRPGQKSTTSATTILEEALGTYKTAADMSDSRDGVELIKISTEGGKLTSQTIKSC